MNGWTLSGLTVFGLFALIGLGDVMGLFPGFTGIALAAGLNSQVWPLYGAIPSLFSLSIGLTAGLTLFRVLQGKRQRTAGSARLVGYTFMVFGVYELIIVLTQQLKNPLQIASIGLMFGLIGFLVIWLGWRVARAL